MEYIDKSEVIAIEVGILMDMEEEKLTLVSQLQRELDKAQVKAFLLEWFIVGTIVVTAVKGYFF